MHGPRPGAPLPNAAFRWRSHEIARSEGLGEDVVAFAVPLPALAPNAAHLNELMEKIRGFGGDIGGADLPRRPKRMRS